MMEQMQKHLSNPATADMITTFVETMKPEDLAGILKQSGMDVTPEQVQSHSISSTPWLILQRPELSCACLFTAAYELQPSL